MVVVYLNQRLFQSNAHYFIFTEPKQPYTHFVPGPSCAGPNWWDLIVLLLCSVV